MENNIFENNENHNYEYENQEYYLIKDNIIYKMTVERNINEIIIRYRNYSINCNINELSVLFKNKFENIYQCYEFINNIFSENNIKIEKITSKKEMKIILSVGKRFEMILLYEKENNNFILKISEYIIFSNIKEIINEIN